jgi:GH25 family lysozyme M1 (1,4-beta-N-acetylmuramidase)
VRRLIVATALTLALIPAAAASASVYTEVLNTYQATGSIPPCRFSSGQLSAALKGIDTYGQQYFADFSDAVQSALAARPRRAGPRSRPGARVPAARRRRCPRR